MCYDFVRKKMFIYDKDNNILSNSKSRNWAHLIFFGDYDIRIGYAGNFDPDRKLNNNTAKWLYGFNPKEIKVAFINKEVFKYLTSPRKPKKIKNSKYNPYQDLEEWFAICDNYKKLHASILISTNKKEFLTETQTLLSMSLRSSGDRFEFLNHWLRTWCSKLMKEPELHHCADETKKRLKQLYTLCYNLWDIQIPICPSHSLAPQGGWYNDLKPIKEYHEQMIKIYNKKQKQLKKEGF